MAASPLCVPSFQMAPSMAKLYAVSRERERAVISGLHHYALEVPDLAVAEGFLQDFGLETGEKDGSLVAQCPTFWRTSATGCSGSASRSGYRPPAMSCRAVSGTRCFSRRNLSR